MERRGRWLAIAVVATATGAPTRCGPPDRVVPAEKVTVLNDNGAWSWFEDERAVVDPVAGILLVSSVASGAGTDGAARHGNIEVVAHHYLTGITERTVLHAGLEADDHDSAALFVRPDGRYVAMYSTHSADRLTRWRVSRHPGDARAWEAEATFDHAAAVSYSNLYPAANERHAWLYGFVRSIGRDPHIITSRDNGSTWLNGGRLLDGPGRPYVRYAADGSGRIHLITTEQHPDDYATSIYHGVVADDQLLRSDGAIVDANLGDERAVPPESLTRVFAGDATRRAWSVDLQVDRAGLPYAVFSVQSAASSNQYYFAHFDGSQWRVHFMAHAGSALYPTQPHYTGLVALDPSDPGRVFVSTDVHPATGIALISNGDHQQHHELYEGVTADGGASWCWRAVTADSSVDNIRPVVPVWDANHTALLWLRGTYTSYRDYDLDVVGIVSIDTSGVHPSAQDGDVPALTRLTAPRRAAPQRSHDRLWSFAEHVQDALNPSGRNDIRRWPQSSGSSAPHLRLHLNRAAARSPSSRDERRSPCAPSVPPADSSRWCSRPAPAVSDSHSPPWRRRHSRLARLHASLATPT
jgi:hypothetical protein